MPKSAMSLKVPKKLGEKAIALAVKNEWIDRMLCIGREDDFLFVPLRLIPGACELGKLETLSEVDLVRRDFEEKRQPSENITQALTGKLQPDLLAMVPQAFDIVGDIVITEIPQQLKEHQQLIGEAIMQTHPSVKAVLGKAGDVSGVFRVREYAFIAGEHRTATVHREFGCSYHVDVAKAYFSPRLSHEHKRVAAKVQAGEVVADLFAGVGPFSVLIGKKCPEAKVYGVDLNPDAVELLKLNVRANKVEGNVFPVYADAREIASAQLKGVADRVIMNLPETAIDFLDAACNAIKSAGGIVHFYGFVRKPDTAENLEQRFASEVERCGRRVEAFVLARSIRETAPFESQVVLDVEIR
jgi:tRNA (guanine37-N1)-methyltransferase